MPLPLIAAALGGSAMSAASSYFGAKKMAAAAKYTADLQNQQYERSRKDLAPWRTAGETALTEWMDRLKAGPGAVETSPGYAFRLAEGNKALERGASATGTDASGKQKKSLLRYAQDYASNEYSSFYDRYLNTLKSFGEISGQGESAAAQTGALGASAAARQGAALMEGARAQASGYQDLADTGYTTLLDLATLPKKSGYQKPGVRTDLPKAILFGTLEAAAAGNQD